MCAACSVALDEAERVNAQSLFETKKLSLWFCQCGINVENNGGYYAATIREHNEQKTNRSIENETIDFEH